MSSTSSEAVLAEFIHDIQIESVDKRIQHETTRTRTSQQCYIPLLRYGRQHSR